MKVWRAEDIPDEYLEAIRRLIEAGERADAGEWGEDLSDLTPEEMVRRLIE